MWRKFGTLLRITCWGGIAVGLVVFFTGIQPDPFTKAYMAASSVTLFLDMMLFPEVYR